MLFLKDVAVLATVFVAFYRVGEVLGEYGGVAVIVCSLMLGAC